MISRFDNIKNLYRQIVASELISQAGEKEEEKEELEGLAEGLLTEEIEQPKPQVPTKKEKEEFVPLEDLGEQLGGGPAPPKKTPILPHREKVKTLDITMPTEMESTKFTPGAIKGKVCDICGRFNFPAWKKECSFCKRTYNFMRDLVDFKGLTPAKAAKAIAAGQTRIPTDDEFTGIITSPERLPVKKQHYLTEEQLKEIWMKGGKILLPELPETLDQRFEDKRGLVGVPASIKLQNALETQLNVEKVVKEVYDPQTGQTFKTKDVYFGPDGEPVPVKYSERDFFSLADIAKKLRLDVTGILKQIASYNDEQGLTQSDPKAIKPVRYYDELNQIFSWKNSIEPVFKDRIKEVYEMFKNTYLSNLSRRKEKLDEEILKLELSINMLKHNKEKIRSEIEKHSDRKALAMLFKLRQEASEITQKANELKNEPTKRTELVEKLNKINEEKAPLETKYGKDLDLFTQKMKAAADELIRVGKRIERMKQSRTNIISKAKEYIEAVGAPGKTPEELKPADLQKAQTGHSVPVDGDINLEELGAQLAGEKKASRINKLLKLAEDPKKWWEEETEKHEPLPGQLELKFPKDYNLTKKEQDEVNQIMKDKLTREEAEYRFFNSNDPLAEIDDDKLTGQQRKEVDAKIKALMSEHPTEEEAITRVKSMRPSEPKALKSIVEKVKPEGSIFEDRECPFCKEKKITKGSDRCSKCGFISAPNRKDVIVERTAFKLVYDKDGNPIPKLDESGAQMIDFRGNPMYKKRPEKQYSLVSIQFDDLGQPKWAQARKVSAATPDAGAKTQEEREKFYERISKEPPKIRELKPITKGIEDFRTIYEWVTDEETGKERKIDTKQKEHKQKCKGCPDPWVKIKPEEFGEYLIVENAYKFAKGEEMDTNFKAWKFQEIYQPKKEEVDKRMIQTPTILPMASSRFERILKLSMMP